MTFVNSLTSNMALIFFYLQQRLWVKTNLKLAKLWLDRHEYSRLNKVNLAAPSSNSHDNGANGR
jgi:hypothetical protein